MVLNRTWEGREGGKGAEGWLTITELDSALVFCGRAELRQLTMIYCIVQNSYKKGL